MQQSTHAAIHVCTQLSMHLQCKYAYKPVYSCMDGGVRESSYCIFFGILVYCVVCPDPRTHHWCCEKNIKRIVPPQHSTIKQAFIFHCTLLFTLWGQRLTLTSKMAEVMFGKTRYGSLVRALQCRPGPCMWAHRLWACWSWPIFHYSSLIPCYCLLLWWPVVQGVPYGISQKKGIFLEFFKFCGKFRPSFVRGCLSEKLKTIFLPLWNSIWDTLYDAQWARNIKLVLLLLYP